MTELPPTEIIVDGQSLGRRCMQRAGIPFPREPVVGDEIQFGSGLATVRRIEHQGSCVKVFCSSKQNEGTQ